MASTRSNIELATLAVLNSPDLKVARADAGVGRAQAFQDANRAADTDVEQLG